MKKQLLFDFSVDKENNTIEVKREFEGRLPLVWRAWTTPELLDQWWGPEPWRAETKSMDFREGGHWLYAMAGPEGEKHWAKADYITIKQEELIRARDGFCDENGVLDPRLPQNAWEMLFSEKDGRTLVDIAFVFDNTHDLETNLKMGFKEGFTAGLEQLDELLQTLE